MSSFASCRAVALLAVCFSQSASQSVHSSISFGQFGLCLWASWEVATKGDLGPCPPAIILLLPTRQDDGKVDSSPLFWAWPHTPTANPALPPTSSRHEDVHATEGEDPIRPRVSRPVDRLKLRFPVLIVGNRRVQGPWAPGPPASLLALHQLPPSQQAGRREREGGGDWGEHLGQLPLLIEPALAAWARRGRVTTSVLDRGRESGQWFVLAHSFPPCQPTQQQFIASLTSRRSPSMSVSPQGGVRWSCGVPLWRTDQELDREHCLLDSSYGSVHMSSCICSKAANRRANRLTGS